MAENVKKLAKSDSFRGLQDRVSFWVQDYNVSPGGRPQGSHCLVSPHSLDRG